MKKKYVEFEYEIDKFVLHDICTEGVSSGNGLEDSNDFAGDDFDF